MTVAPMIGQKLQGQVQNTMAPMPAQLGGATVFNPAAQSSAAVMPAVQTAVQPNVPPTGLIGSEAALMGGLTGGMQTLGAGTAQATNTLNTAINNVGGVQNFSANTGGITGAINQGVSGLKPYAGGGEGAAKLQGDLSGANGPEAQQAAWAAYESSPAMKYQIDQMMEATQQSAAARGGALGGNVLQELQRNAAGIASQDYQNQFANIGTVADRGLGAAAQIGNLKSNQAGILGSLEQANIASKTSQANNQAQIKASLAQDLANTAYSAGIQGAGMLTQTGGLLSQGRTNAGVAMANNANQAAQGISQLLNQQGIVVSDMMSKDISSITDLIYQSGMQGKVDNQQLAAILANIAGGQASNAMQGYSNLGAAQAAGIVGAGNAVQSGMEIYAENRK